MTEDEKTDKLFTVEPLVSKDEKPVATLTAAPTRRPFVRQRTPSHASQVAPQSTQSQQGSDKPQTGPITSSERKQQRRTRSRYGAPRSRLASERRLPPTQMHHGKIGAPEGFEASKEETLKIIPLGGLGEVGKNMYVVEYRNDIVVIDAGVMFPRDNMPGIDFVIPNTQYLEERKQNIHGLILTHGHFDHVGAVSYLQEKLGNPDIYTAELTKRLVEKRHSEFPHLPKFNFNVMKHGDRVKFGEHIDVEFFHMNHNIPDDLAVIIRTPAGVFMHTADFKFDPNPLNDTPADLKYLKELGDVGVDILMCESTDAEEEGHSISEQTIYDNMEIIFKEATGMIIAGTFSSMINRMQQMVQLSEKYGRKVVFDGYSLKTNVEIAKEMGYMKITKGTQITMDQVDSYPRDKVTVIATGALGQENAALMRIVNQEHRHLQIFKGDSVIFSSSIIPGNERSVQYVKDGLYRAGARVYHYQMMDIHAGGHAKKEDLRQILDLVRPKFLMPHHGHYSMMVTLGEIAKERGVAPENVIIADNGQIIHFTKDKWWFDKVSAPANYIMIDGLGVGDIGNVVMRDRQVLAEDGMFVIVVLLDTRTGKVRGSPDIISRGFIYLKENREMLASVRRKVRSIIESKAMLPEANAAYLKDEIRNQVGLYLFQQTERRPMVLPVLIEV